MQRQHFSWPVKTMGTDYYPEHWDRSLWESDLSRMKQVGISTIRIAEFAWSLIEPREGEFTYSFFDDFLDLCARMDMKVIFGTPTATPPAWLTEKYPEVLNCDIHGISYRHGGRRHYNYNSPKYLELSARIVEKEASHYGPHPAVTGWQIDNELNCETADFYSEADNEAFRIFLKKKYGTLEELNRAWGTVFWNQQYTSWTQIHVIGRTVSGSVNPHQHLDYLRFVSDSCLSFAKRQADIIRAYKKPGDFITTNGMFGHLDNHTLENEILDVYTYDSYPNFARTASLNERRPEITPLADRRTSYNLTRVRSVCRHFGIMEQQSGPGGSSSRMIQASPRPGQLTLWAMQSVAHGADYIGFFRWRTACFGTEIYWHGILNYDNRDNRRLAEVSDFYRKLRTLDETAGAEFTASFALLHDYDNEFDQELDAWHGMISRPSEEEIFAASTLSHTPCNIINLTDETKPEELSPYPLVIYPHPVMLDESRVRVLKAYTEAGGTLLVGCRSGLKDSEGHCVMMPQPGLLANLTGTTVEDFSFTLPEEEKVKVCLEKGEVQEAPVFNDLLQPAEETKVLGTYHNGIFRGQPALTEHRFGKGRVLHWGSTFTRQNTEFFFRYTGVFDLFRNLLKVPDEVELTLQKKNGFGYIFVLNYADHAVNISLQQPVTDLYSGRSICGQQSLPAYGTAVLKFPASD